MPDVNLNPKTAEGTRRTICVHESADVIVHMSNQHVSEQYRLPGDCLGLIIPGTMPAPRPFWIVPVP
jgi:hypothetical protein